MFSVVRLAQEYIQIIVGELTLKLNIYGNFIEWNCYLVDETVTTEDILLDV